MSGWTFPSTTCHFVGGSGWCASPAARPLRPRPCSQRCDPDPSVATGWGGSEPAENLLHQNPHNCGGGTHVRHWESFHPLGEAVSAHQDVPPQGAERGTHQIHGNLVPGTLRHPFPQRSPLLKRGTLPHLAGRAGGHEQSDLPGKAWPIPCLANHVQSVASSQVPPHLATVSTHHDALPIH